MNLIELNRALRMLRLGGIAAVLETRLHQAQTEPMAPIDFISCLVSDELTRRSERLLERRRKQAQFRDPQIVQHQSAFVISDSVDHLCIHDDGIKCYQVGNEEPDLVFFVEDIEQRLLPERNVS